LSKSEIARFVVVREFVLVVNGVGLKLKNLKKPTKEKEKGEKRKGEKIGGRKAT
jgi:hypothetical protein